MRELSPALRPHDGLTVWVPAETWHCPYCLTPAGDGAGTTVEWLTGPHDGPDGRCRECGVKLVLAAPGEAVPSVEEQLRGAA